LKRFARLPILVWVILVRIVLLAASSDLNSVIIVLSLLD
jgi:hypothetical protein